MRPRFEGHVGTGIRRFEDGWDDEARRLTLQFDTDAPDFPFPMTEMVGGWKIDPDGDQTEVVVRYEYTVRGGLLGEIVAPLVAHRSWDGLEATITRMAEDAMRPAGAAAGA